jgi:dipeptidyl aminopeptidase/acylaminoacyl peptidase
VLSPLSGELAIVDLVSRRVLQSATLDLPATAPRSEEGPFGGLWASLRGLLVSEALAKVPFSERLQVSPDGRRLYAIGARPERNGVRADGVWVIDTQAWRLAHHWLAGSEAWTVLLSADGRSLYVQDPPGGGAGSGALRVVDTATGGEVSRTDPLGNGQVSTVAELYRDRYGRSPRATDAARAAGTTFVPVAPMVVDVSPRQGVAGDAVTLEARFVDAAGRTVEPGQADVRFEPPAHVVAILSRGADPNDRQTVPLDPASYAIYQGSAILSAPDSWSPGSLSVQVIAEWPDGLRRRAFVRDAVVVQPAFVGSDRRRYVLRVTSEPDPPVAEQPALVRIAFVDAETGAPAADGPQPVADLPALKDATFFGDGGFTRQQLAEVGQGVYEGEVRLWSAGTWRVMATLGAPVDRTYTIGVLYTTAASR